MAKIKLSQRYQLILEFLEEGWISSNAAESFNSELAREILVPHRIIVPYAGAMAYKGKGVITVISGEGESDYFLPDFKSTYPDDTLLIHESSPILYQPDARKRTRIFRDEKNGFSYNPGIRCANVIRNKKSIESYPLEYIFHFKYLETKDPIVSIPTKIDLDSIVVALDLELDEQQTNIVKKMLRGADLYECSFNHTKTEPFVNFMKKTMDGYGLIKD